MAWGKLDDGWHRHPKVRRCSMAARGLWATAHSWTSDMELDGFIPLDMVSRLCDGEVAAPLIAELTAVHPPFTTGLWEAVADGYQMHDYFDMNPSKRDLSRARRQTRIRVQKHRARNGVTNGHVTRLKRCTPGRDGTGTITTDLDLSLSTGGVQGEPKKRRPKRPVRDMPPDFTLTADLRDYAERAGLDADLEFEHFKAHHESLGNQFVNWPRAFQKWCMNAYKFERRP